MPAPFLVAPVCSIAVTDNDTAQKSQFCHVHFISIEVQVAILLYMKQVTPNNLTDSTRPRCCWCCLFFFSTLPTFPFSNVAFDMLWNVSVVGMWPSMAEFGRTHKARIFCFFDLLGIRKWKTGARRPYIITVHPRTPTQPTQPTRIRKSES